MVVASEIGENVVGRSRPRQSKKEPLESLSQDPDTFVSLLFITHSGGTRLKWRDLQDMTDLPNTSPQFSERDMLVYDHKRGSIQHTIANVDIPPTTAEFFHTTESISLATAIYSILAMYSFRPPLKLYGDLAKRLKGTLVMADHGCLWGVWWDLLLWTMFVGGYAALGRDEKRWYSRMIGVVLLERRLIEWWEVRKILEEMPVNYLLWELFEVLWHEAVVMLDGDLEHMGS